ncbi:MAG: hypothetical protein ILP18_03940 [Treponema sp.]|nr:hypothetical protein [Treponema sp.]
MLLAFASCDDSGDLTAELFSWSHDVTVQNRSDGAISITGIDSTYDKISLPESIGSGKDISFRLKSTTLGTTDWKLTVRYGGNEFIHKSSCKFGSFDSDDSSQRTYILIEKDEDGGLKFSESRRAY